jgi:hypothetical protein
MVGAEQLLGALDGQTFQGIDKLLALVVALAGVPLAVLFPRG